LILSREAGNATEPEDISVEAILPNSSLEADSVEEFFNTLDTEKNYFNKMIEKATAEDKVIRYIAKLENQKASVSLQYLGPDSPFYGLKGSDNMIVFWTKRYTQRPLVVRGPGAGAEVTAAGVFSEIISIGNKNYFGYN